MTAVQGLVQQLVPQPRRCGRYVPPMTPELVKWTARCPHGRDAEWSALRIENEWPSTGARVVVSCPCTCSEPAP